MAKAPPPELLLFFDHGDPATAKARSLVDGVVADQIISVRELNARDATVGPLITRYEVCELPTVVLLRGRKQVWAGAGKGLTRTALLKALELR